MRTRIKKHCKFTFLTNLPLIDHIRELRRKTWRMDYNMKNRRANVGTSPLERLIHNYAFKNGKIDFVKGDKLPLSKFHKKTVEYIKCLSNDESAVFRGAINKQGELMYQFEVNVKDSMIEQCGKLNWFLVYPETMRMQELFEY